MRERLVLIGSNELVVNNVAPPMKEKQMIQNKLYRDSKFYFLGKIYKKKYEKYALSLKGLVAHHHTVKRYVNECDDGNYQIPII